MRSPRLVALASVLVLVLGAAPLAARAVDAPHTDGLYCSNCHMGHNAPGGSLTKTLGNANLCQSCHTLQSGFGFPWGDSNQATPGVSGHSHRWDASASNRGATPPSSASADPVEAEMGKRLENGNLMCSTCHDQHQADALPLSGRGFQHASAVTFAGTGTGTVALTGTVAADATAKAYLVDIVTQGSGTTARFRLSNDNGTSWFGCTAPTTYSYVAYTGANSCQAGPSVALNDGAKVNVAFTGGANTFRVGDQFAFYVSYPFLRADDTDARMCVTCHKDRDMRWQDVEGGNANGVPGGVKTVALGTTVFHHPVGQALNANGRNYDQAAPLDASGVAQATGDGNATNDLVLGSTGVNCLSCHYPHNADSNSLTTDAR